MNEICIVVICVETHDSYTKLCAATNKPLTNDLIRNIIRDGFIELGRTDYTIDDVEDIFVAFGGDTFDGILSPEIDDVWPTDFNENFNRDTRKKGGENYRHGKDDVFKNRR